MADNLVVTRSTTQASVVPDGEVISAEEVTTLNGEVVTAQKAGRAILSLRTADATAVDITAAAPLPVTGPLTDAQLRATAVTVSGTVGVTGVATEATLDARTGSLTETAPATDTASSGINGRLQRLAQRLTSLVALFPAALGAGGGMKVDGSGTALPVSGSVTANAGTNLNTSALALDSTVAKDGADITTPSPAMPAGGVGIRGWLSAIWTKLNGSLAVTGTFWQATQPVSGTVTATGPLTDAELRATAVPVSLASVPSHAVTNAGTFAVQNTAATPAGTNNIGDVDVASLPTVSSATVASVSSSATNVTLLASSATRKGASFYNNSTQVLYLKHGATATASDFTIAMAANSYYELPQPVYTGIIDGIWAAANGAALVTSV